MENSIETLEAKSAKTMRLFKIGGTAKYNRFKKAIVIDGEFENMEQYDNLRKCIEFGCYKGQNFNIGGYIKTEMGVFFSMTIGF